MTDIAVSAPLLTWAQRRSGRAPEEMRHKFPQWDGRLTEEATPSLAQIEKIAAYTRVPLGYFFLPAPPAGEIPIPDFRDGRDRSSVPSADLLDTIYLNQRRQAWYEDHLATLGDPAPLPFVGSITPKISPRPSGPGSSTST